MKVSIKLKLGIVVSSLAGIILVMFLFTWNSTSNQKDDGLVINLAGRQRMLIQKMTKEMLHFLAVREKTGTPDETLSGNVQQTMKVFDITLNALKESGRAPLSLNLDGDSRECPKAEEPAYSQLGKVQKQWQKFSKHVNNVLDNFAEEDTEWVLNNNTLLLKEMNNAVVMMQAQSESKVNYLITIQIFGVIAGLILSSFAFFVVFSILKRLRSVSDFARHLSEGDFTFSVHAGDENELEEILTELNDTARDVGKMVGKIKEKTTELDSSSKLLSSFSEELVGDASNMNEQAGSVAAASEEMSVNMSSVSAAVSQADSSINIVSNNTSELNTTVGEIAQNTENMHAV